MARNLLRHQLARLQAVVEAAGEATAVETGTLQALELNPRKMRLEPFWWLRVSGQRLG
ncbi:hypothetical protein [Microcoleus sp. FACHB-68]|uniref:hypothetical protein n=1 Tax=Microcoleus sp. FACHB-68 TaxID=2692826 RepID=UPI001F54F9AE|nr:hypothetical protein [Microcoleus sp. FACHB-68]